MSYFTSGHTNIMGWQGYFLRREGGVRTYHMVKEIKYREIGTNIKVGGERGRGKCRGLELMRKEGKING